MVATSSSVESKYRSLGAREVFALLDAASTPLCAAHLACAGAGGRRRHGLFDP